jgi:cytoskeletal protein RodZ
MIEFKNRKFNQIKDYINNRITEYKASVAEEQIQSENEPESESEPEDNTESTDESTGSGEEESIGIQDTEVLVQEACLQEQQETQIQVGVQTETESVSGLDLITMLTDVLINIDETTKYTGQYVDMYKMLQTMKQ